MRKKYLLFFIYMLFRKKSLLKRKLKTEKKIGEQSHSGKKDFYRDLDALYCRERKIQERRQVIEDASFILKQRYAEDAAAREYIDSVRCFDRVLFECEMERWTDEEMRGKLAQAFLDDIAGVKKIHDAFAADLRDRFERTNGNFLEIVDAARALLDAEGEDPWARRCILFLRDVYGAYWQSRGRGRAPDFFREKFLDLRGRTLSLVLKKDTRAFRSIHEEFRDIMEIIR